MPYGQRPKSAAKGRAELICSSSTFHEIAHIRRLVSDNIQILYGRDAEKAAMDGLAGTGCTMSATASSGHSSLAEPPHAHVS